MPTIVYLDVDDEITSAAARLRGAAESRVALVLPHGSRLSTSRMNFRLLAREAAQRGRELSIVAPDAGTRALAASAGLPVFASVAELEGPEAGEDEPEEATTARADAAASAVTTAPAAAGSAAAAAARIREAVTGPRSQASDASPRRPRHDGPDDATLIMPAPAAAPGPDARHGRQARDVPVVASRRGYAIRGGALAAAGVLALTLVVGGVAAWLYLPTATITIRPKVETIRLPPFTVTADPTVSQVDADRAVIPATTIEIPLSASVEQPATGERVEETRATGEVRFESINTVGPVAVPEGTRISTLGGIVFVTTEAVTVPAAQVAGSTIERGVATTGIRARLAGPEGNVDAGDITQVPDFLRTQQVSAINPTPTSGGTREVFQQIQQADIDAALEALQAQLASEFDAAVADPPGVPPGSTTFPDAAVLGDPAITPDPQSLLGQEVASFTLEATATGTLLAVDEAPLEGIVLSRIDAQVSPDHELVSGSIRPTVGEGVVSGGVVTFTLSAEASETAILDPAAIEAQVRGRPVAEAERQLADLGDVSVEAWPDFVTTVPTFDERVEVVIAPPAGEGASGGAPDGTAEPVPSG
ncbi:MAG TPA: baseplate J/gp47 family protein [Candidatus Limnocylindrales bacterium]|nr:baseplate J/gp47 family protein [Candidatus Limnocylindrales bacterium]